MYRFEVDNRRLTDVRTLEEVKLQEHFSDLNHPTVEEITLFELEYGVDLTDMFEKLKELNNV